MTVSPRGRATSRLGTATPQRCAAALAGSGGGEDVLRPDEAERDGFRCLALGWLKADLAAWSRRQKADPKAGPDVLKALRTWREEGDLAGVREADALAKLPEAEHDDCRKLWADVDALLTKAQAIPK